MLFIEIAPAQFFPRIRLNGAYSVNALLYRRIQSRAFFPHSVVYLFASTHIEYRHYGKDRSYDYRHGQRNPIHSHKKNYRHYYRSDRFQKKRYYICEYVLYFDGIAVCYGYQFSRRIFTQKFVTAAMYLIESRTAKFEVPGKAYSVQKHPLEIECRKAHSHEREKYSAENTENLIVFVGAESVYQKSEYTRILFGTCSEQRIEHSVDYKRQHLRYEHPNRSIHKSAKYGEHICGRVLLKIRYGFS